MHSSWFSKRLGPLHALSIGLVTALIACTLCLLLPITAYSQTTPAPVCPSSDQSGGQIVFENEAFYCLPGLGEQAEKPDSNPIATFAENRNIPIDALKAPDSDSSPDGKQQQANLYYFESPTSNEKTSLLTIPANASEENAADILEKTKRAVQRYRQREFGCALTNQTVSIGKIYKEPFLCVESGILNESVKARAERIASQINKVIAGDINVETLEIIPVPELRNSLGISKYIGLESEADLDNQAMAIVSRSQVLANQDKIILIVTDLDTVLYSQDNSGENSLPGDVDVSDMLSPYELSNLYLEKITRTSKYLYEDLVRPVTFNLGPYFWVRPRLSSNPRPNPYLCPPGSVNNVQPSDGQGPNTRGQITLFCVQSLSTYYNASFRADEISKNIDTFANQVNHFPYIPLFQSVKDLIVQPENEGGEIKIRYGENDDQEIMTVTQKETSSNTSDARMEAANTLLVSIQETVRAYRSVYYRTLIVTFIFSGVSLLSIWRIFKKTRRRRRRVTDYSRLWLIPILAGFSIFGYFLPFVRRFPPVQAFGSTVGAISTYLFSDFSALLSIVAWGAVVFWLLPIVLFEFLPKLFNGVIALLSFRWLGASRRTFLRLIHNQDTSPQNATKGLTVSKQKASISILRFIIFAITCVMASPHLPGAGTVYLAGISGFVALAFSLSASAAIGDIIAGLVLIYFSQLNEGSWIQIGDMRGEIIEQNLVVHRIKTAKNEVVTIPNAKVLNSVVTDYSESSKQGEPLVLHTTITLGYDVPWEDVHRLLKEAAADVDEDLLRKDKRPFVRQLSLDDFYVSYQLNVFTDRIDRISLIYSELHKQIQTKLHSAGIEILSPHFEASWDAQNPMIPTKFLENSLANNGEMPEKKDAERGRRGDAEIVP